METDQRLESSRYLQIHIHLANFVDYTYIIVRHVYSWRHTIMTIIIFIIKTSHISIVM